MSHPHPELSAPAALPKGGLRIIPLGGLGEVGRNMTVFEYDEPAADRRLRRPLPRGEPPRRRPDPPRLRRHPGPPRPGRGAGPHPRPRGPHRRHAVPPARARRHPARRLRADPGPARLQAARAPPQGDRPPRGQGGRPARRSGPSSSSSSRSTTRSPTRSRSPSAPAPALVLHTGDFKMDQLPLDGRITDLRRVRPARRGGRRPLPHRLHQRRGARASPPPRRTSRRSSTGSSTTATSGSSSPASPPTCTASSRSSTPRSPTTARSGTSVARWCATWRIAQDLGYLHVPPGVMVDAKDLADLPPERQVLISTGSQGEPMSALSRIAQRNHHFVHIEEGDTVILASSLIPGNENAVYRVINGLTRLGRQRRAQGQRPRPRLRPRQRRRAALRLQHRQAAQRAAGARRVSGT